MATNPQAVSKEFQIVPYGSEKSNTQTNPPQLMLSQAAMALRSQTGAIAQIQPQLGTNQSVSTIKKKYFIIEGANASGKTTLVNGLKACYKDLTTVYSIPTEYNAMRELAYNKLCDLASLFLYLSGTMETFNRIKDDFVVFDRSIISSFSIYLSRLPENEWNNLTPLFKEILKFMPEITTIFHLKISEVERMRRINLKLGKDKEADLKELAYEAKKDRARSFLLTQTGIQTVEIDTSSLTIEEVLKIVKANIDLAINNNSEATISNRLAAL